MSDLDVRLLERAVVQGDLHQALALARRLRRSRGRLRVQDGAPVHGPLLALALQGAFDQQGAREVDLVRRAGVPERHAGRWIHALRLLMRGEARSFVWVGRWCRLLGVDPGALVTLAAPTASGGASPGP